MSGEKRYSVYIMSSRSLTLYVGVTNSIYHRALQHKSGEVEGFTKRYRINRLVYYETFKYVGNAIAREKEIKGWSRAKEAGAHQVNESDLAGLGGGLGKPIEPLKPRMVSDVEDHKVTGEGAGLAKRQNE